LRCDAAVSRRGATRRAERFCHVGSSKAGKIASAQVGTPKHNTL